MCISLIHNAADFTNGWPEGTFKEIFSYGTQCNVGFSLENCPALKPLMKGTSDCQYDGVIVDEVSGAPSMSI